MKNRMFVFIALLLLSGSVIAYQLNGTMTRNNDGKYDVWLENPDGRDFYGTATNQDDGTFWVVVKDNKNIVYQGKATENGEDEFDLELMNPETGDMALGSMDED